MDVLKEDISEAKNRLEAWWDHEIIDRPVISYYFPRNEGSIAGLIDLVFFNFKLARNPDAIDTVITDFEQRVRKLT